MSWHNAPVMTSYHRLAFAALLLGALSNACSGGHDDGDLFDESSSGNAVNTSGSVTSTTGAGSVGTGGATATSAANSASFGVQSATSANSGTVTSTSTSASTTTSSTTGAMTAATTGESSTSTSTTGSEPVTVMVDLPEDDDCIEISCPEEAPYLAGCEIEFSVSTDADACVVDEGDGEIFIKSGDTCSGSNVVEGVILCSSVEPDSLDAIAQHCLVQNKDSLVVLDDRCDCETSAGTPGCN